MTRNSNQITMFRARSNVQMHFHLMKRYTGSLIMTTYINNVWGYGEGGSLLMTIYTSSISQPLGGVQNYHAIFLNVFYSKCLPHFVTFDPEQPVLHPHFPVLLELHSAFASLSKQVSEPLTMLHEPPQVLSITATIKYTDETEGHQMRIYIALIQHSILTKCIGIG